MKVTVVGSAHDHGFSDKAATLAAELGKEIARRGHLCIYGPEISGPSLPYLVAKSARENSGTTLAIAIGSARTAFFDPTTATYVVYTEGAAGAAREVVLVNSADAVISVGGGSGTLTEISIAYMNYIPVIAMRGSGGWSDKLIGTYLDERKKYIIEGAESALQALDIAERQYSEFKAKPPQSLVL